jgi:hypothetical protein
MATISLIPALHCRRLLLKTEISSKQFRLFDRHFTSSSSKRFSFVKLAQDVSTNKHLISRTIDVEYTWDAGLALLPLEVLRWRVSPSFGCV